MDLSSLPIVHLLVEALYKGKSGLIPELERHEPINVAELDIELARRSGSQLTGQTRDWVEWYLDSGRLSASESEYIEGDEAIQGKAG